MSPVRFYEKGHEMIYYINYHCVVFMLLSLRMQPHYTVDLRIYFSQDKSALYCDEYHAIFILLCFFCLCFGMLNFCPCVEINLEV